MVSKDRPADKKGIGTEELAKRLDSLDQRLDNIDSVVSALVEKVMSQQVSLGTTCPHCGKYIEVNLVGSRRPTAPR